MNSFFGIGILELMLIIVLAIIVLGPERMPGLIRQIARFIRQMRAIGSELTSQFSEELELLDELNPRKILDEATAPVKEDIDAIQEMTGQKKPAKKATEKAEAKSTKASEKSGIKAEPKTVDKASTKMSEESSVQKEVDEKSTKKSAGTQPKSVAKPSLGETMEEPKPQTFSKPPSEDKESGEAPSTTDRSEKPASGIQKQSASQYSTGQSLTNGVMPKKAEEPVVENSIAPPEILQAATEQTADSSNGNNGHLHKAETPSTETVTEDS